MARVTVVNDYPEFLELMNDILGEIGGHEVTGFDGDETSLEEIVASRPDLLVVDLLIKGHQLTGWGILPLARAHPALASVPIIVLSSEAVETDQRLEEMAAIGNVRLLRKPVATDDLLGAARELLRAVPLH